MASIGPILVVEDDSSVLDITSFLLESVGYGVLTAVNAAEAMTTLEAHPEIGLVLTDVNMPGEMDGIDMVHELHRKGNTVPCVVVSGDAVKARERLDSAVTFLAKPYERRTLLEAVRSALPH